MTTPDWKVWSSRKLDDYHGKFIVRMEHRYPLLLFHEITGAGDFDRERPLTQ